MTKGAASKVISRLEEKGLAQRHWADGQTREQSLILTDKGKALMPRLARLAAAQEDLGRPGATFAVICWTPSRLTRCCVNCALRRGGAMLIANWTSDGSGPAMSMLGSICVALHTAADFIAVLAADRLLQSGAERATRARLLTRISGVPMIRVEKAICEMQASVWRLQSPC
jgi:DNA-binding MarR family transcriptional regulator